MLRSTLLLALLLAASLQGAQMVAFGDSLSDTGFSGPPATNPGGLLWHEYLADDLGLVRAATADSGNSGLNLAVGGSRVSDLQAQVDRYSGRHTWQSGDLCTLWIGGNDILFDPGQDMDALALEVGSIITQLAALGVDHFVVPNLPDTGTFPVFMNDPAAISAGTAATRLFNAALAREMNSRASSLGVRIDQPDVFAFFQAVIANPADLGFINVTEPLESAPSTDPQTYAFWDVVHPTTRSHELLAAVARAVIAPDAPVELVNWAIQPDRSLRLTWLANPEARYEALSGTVPNNLRPAARFTASTVHTAVIAPPSPSLGFYQIRRTGP